MSKYTIGAPTSGAPSSPQAAGEHPPPSSSDRLIRPDQIDGDEATSADRHKLIEELADPTSAGFISSSLHSSSSSVPISARTAHTDGQQTTVVSHFGRNPLSFLQKISSPWNPSSTQQ
ncbi:hypothetical protein ACLOJK_019062 [Asimina triloba]